MKDVNENIYKMFRKDVRFWKLSVRAGKIFKVWWKIVIVIEKIDNVNIRNFCMIRKFC